MKAQRAVFFDRDGVIVDDEGYSFRPESLKVFPDVLPALKLLQEAGFLLIVVTNQSGVARGYFNLWDVFSFHRYLQETVRASGGPRFDGFYICPHLEDGVVLDYRKACDCRKPKSGLIREAIREFEIDPSKSFLVGDRMSDIKAAEGAGVPAALLARKKLPLDAPTTLPTFTTLKQVAEWIIAQS